MTNVFYQSKMKKENQHFSLSLFSLFFKVGTSLKVYFKAQPNLIALFFQPLHDYHLLLKEIMPYVKKF